MERMKFTHNMKILLIDAENNMVEDDELLCIIKEKLQHPFTQTIMIPPINHPWKVILKWEWKTLTKLQSYFMGDLFACAFHSFDNITYQHTEKTLKEIEVELKNKGLCHINHRIRFHISKMPDEISFLRENNSTM